MKITNRTSSDVTTSANPLVSIVINNYNYARFLKTSIDSALNQTYPHCEVIVVDDGSTDESRGVLMNFGNRIVPVLKENGGQGSAFNAGFAASRGEIVIFLDADDWLTPTIADKAVLAFQRPGTIKVHWPLCVVDEKGHELGPLFPPNEMPEGDLREMVLRDGPIYDSNFLPPTSGNAWTRSFLEKVLPMPAEDYDHGADVYLHSLAPLFGSMRSILQPQGYYRTHGLNHYWRASLTDAKVNEYLGRFESSCRALQHQCAVMDIAANLESWKERNFNYQWLRKMKQAKEDLTALLPQGTSYILVNQDEWGEGEPVGGRHAIPFLERDGEYFGPPVDDAAAIAELERQRGLGASHVAFWWTAFWWLEEYAGFRRWLRRNFFCALENERLIAFDLRSAQPDSSDASA